MNPGKVLCRRADRDFRRVPTASLSDRLEAAWPTRSTKTDAEWRKQLTPEQFQVTRKKGTERAFTGELLGQPRQGRLPLRAAAAPSCSAPTTSSIPARGWPSFWQPATEENVATEDDNSYVMRRTEVLCSRCDAHLGHVFEDGPQPDGAALLHQLRVAQVRQEVPKRSLGAFR